MSWKKARCRGCSPGRFLEVAVVRMASLQPSPFHLTLNHIHLRPNSVRSEKLGAARTCLEAAQATGHPAAGHGKRQAATAPAPGGRLRLAPPLLGGGMGGFLGALQNSRRRISLFFIGPEDGYALLLKSSLKKSCGRPEAVLLLARRAAAVPCRLLAGLASGCLGGAGLGDGGLGGAAGPLQGAHGLAGSGRG